MVCQITLDDKGRLSLPAKIRGGLKGNSVVLTQGLPSREGCNGLWLFMPAEWESFVKKLMAQPASLAKSIAIQNHFIAPKEELEIDRAGRITVPPSLREYAGLVKDCEILEAFGHLEIWDSGRYSKFSKGNEGLVLEFMEEQGPMSLFS